MPEVKKQYLAEAEEQVEKITKQYRRGMLDDDERYNAIIKVWTDTNDKLTKALMDNLDDLNPIYMMANSGARGSVNQIRQLAGMRGLMANTSGKAVEIPIRANFREGLNVLAVSYTHLDVYKRQVLDEVEYMTADVEDGYTIAQANEPLDENNHFIDKKITARRLRDFVEVPPSEIRCV